ncbi:MAG: hypothetical protein ABSG68_24835 [Thermoguttaceae bacterium]
MIESFQGDQLVVTGQYTYDSAGRLTGITYEGPDGSTLAFYGYTYAGPAQSSSLPSGEGQGEGASAWSPSGPMMPCDSTGGLDLTGLDQPVPAADLITGVTSIDGTASYSYDPTGQLTGATYTGGQSDEYYSYDPNGNRTSATGSASVIGANNELLSDGTYTYSYDAEGNRTERVSIATGAVTDYTWDNRNRLVEVTDRASAGRKPLDRRDGDDDCRGRLRIYPRERICLRWQPDRLGV